MLKQFITNALCSLILVSIMKYGFHNDVGWPEIILAFLILYAGDGLFCSIYRYPQGKAK